MRLFISGRKIIAIVYIYQTVLMLCVPPSIHTMLLALCLCRLTVDGCEDWPSKNKNQGPIMYKDMAVKCKLFYTLRFLNLITYRVWNSSFFSLVAETSLWVHINPQGCNLYKCYIMYMKEAVDS